MNTYLVRRAVFAVGLVVLGLTAARAALPEGWIEGADITVSSSVRLDTSTPLLNSITVTKGGTLTFTNWMTRLSSKTVMIEKGGKVTCVGPFSESEMSNRVWIACQDLTVDGSSSITVDDKGYKTKNGPGYHVCGGTYGGVGAKSYTSGNWMALPYGDAETPLDPGSGGSLPSATKDGRAGGAVLIEATGTVSVYGSILASATLSAYNGAGTGAGSGGSVCIRCKRFVGNDGTKHGVIRANGSDGQSNWNAIESPGGSHSLPGGGGRISISYDPSAQQTGDFDGMVISAAPGRLTLLKRDPGTSYTRAPTMADQFRQDADLGTLWFSDNQPVVALLGKGLSGQLVHTNRFDFESVDMEIGHVRFAADGCTVTVSGDFLATGALSRVEFGGGVATNRGNICEHLTATSWTLTVGGDLAVRGGARLDFRSAPTNGIDAAGASVKIAGAMLVDGRGDVDEAPDGKKYYYASDSHTGDGKLYFNAAGSAVYLWCDSFNGGAPELEVGSLTIGEDACVSADRRGFSSGFNEKDGMSAHATGFGPGGGRNSSNGSAHGGGGHGGLGGLRDFSSTLGNGGGTNDFVNPPRPTLAGSGGGASGNSPSKYAVAFGGGVARIKSAGTIRVDGTLSADGETEVNEQVIIGGGAGGTILLDCFALVGTESGRISAVGGNSFCGASNRTGSGGGGRIAVWTGKSWRPDAKARHCTITEMQPDSFKGVIDVSGGITQNPPDKTYVYDGGAGTIDFVDYKGIPGLMLIFR